MLSPHPLLNLSSRGSKNPLHRTPCDVGYPFFSNLICCRRSCRFLLLSLHWSASGRALLRLVTGVAKVGQGGPRSAPGLHDLFPPCHPYLMPCISVATGCGPVAGVSEKTEISVIQRTPSRQSSPSVVSSSSNLPTVLTPHAWATGCHLYTRMILRRRAHPRIFFSPTAQHGHL